MMKQEIAKILLHAGAVTLSPDEPYTWASGIESPIYCDNRLIMSDPGGRRRVAEGLAEVIRKHYPATTVIAGTATAGIPHAAWVADILGLPMVYIRSKAKGHGRNKQIEGRVKPDDRAIIVEDLISTGGSSLTAAAALRDEGIAVEGIVSIFTYGLDKADRAFAEADLSYTSLTDFDALAEVAARTGAIREESLAPLKDWHDRLKSGALQR